MKDGDVQLGTPGILYKNTKAIIESLPNIPEGAVAYATDIDQFGTYNGTTWIWNPIYGTYTPTLTNSVNVSSSTQRVCSYFQVGGMVTVVGAAGIDPTNIADTQLGVSLPISSNLGVFTDLLGSGSFYIGGSTTCGIYIIGDATNNRAILEFVPPSATAGDATFVFSYRVL